MNGKVSHTSQVLPNQSYIYTFRSYDSACPTTHTRDGAIVHVSHVLKCIIFLVHFYKAFQQKRALK